MPEYETEVNGVVYSTVNKSDLTADEIAEINSKAIKKAADEHVILYLTINSGKPGGPPPPPPPPGGD